MMLEAFSPGVRRAVPILVAVSLVACGGGSPDPSSGERTTAVASGGTPLPARSPQSAEPGATPRPARGTAWVVFGNATAADTIVAEVASTAAQRAQGLMDREELGDDAGMLFVFQDMAERAFWMRNTYIPLDIAYMDAAFRIIDIQPMEPESEELVESSGPAQYALEVNRGWFAAHGVEVGTTPQVFFGM